MAIKLTSGAGRVASVGAFSTTMLIRFSASAGYLLLVLMASPPEIDLAEVQRSIESVPGVTARLRTVPPVSPTTEAGLREWYCCPQIGLAHQLQW